MADIVDQHLDAMYGNTVLTKAVVFGSVSTRGFFDDEEMSEQDAAGFGRDIELRSVVLRRADANQLTEHQEITVDDVTYLARKKLRVNDGREVRVILAEVTT